MSKRKRTQDQDEQLEEKLLDLLASRKRKTQVITPIGFPFVVPQPTALAEEEEEDVVFTEARQSEGPERQATRQPSKRKARKKKTPAKRGTKRKRTPNIKARLLKKLRAKKKLLQANLRAVERDIRSLSPRKRLTEG